MQNQEIPLFDIYEYIYIPFWKTTWFLYVMIINVVVLCSVIFFIFYRARKRKQQQKMAWDSAIELLSALDCKNIKHKEFYFHLTHVLKSYLAVRYCLPLKDKTDLEVITLVQSSGVPVSLHESIKEIFSGPLFIKFANQKGCIERMEHDKERCIQLIEQTKFPQGA